MSEQELQKIEDEAKNFVFQNLKNSKLILDVGCGDGATSKEMSSALSALVVAVDPQLGNSLEDSLSPLFLPMIAEAITFSGNTFEAITCLYTFHELTNQEQALEEMYRVLKPLGTLVVVDYLKDSEAEKIYEEKYFTEQQFKNFCIKRGFKLEEQRVFGNKDIIVLVCKK